jgi:hypothetical protein
MGGVFSAAIMILDEKKQPVPAKFGPFACRTFRDSARRRGRRSAATKTIYQPCGQRNECAALRTDFDIVVVSAWRVAAFCCGGLTIFAAAIDPDEPYSR